MKDDDIENDDLSKPSPELEEFQQNDSDDPDLDKIADDDEVTDETDTTLS